MVTWKGIAMENLIIVGILLTIVGMAVLYIWKEKKKGTRCIGCPSGGCCSRKGCGNKEGYCKCHSDNN